MSMNTTRLYYDNDDNDEDDDDDDDDDNGAENVDNDDIDDNDDNDDNDLNSLRIIIINHRMIMINPLFKIMKMMYSELSHWTMV
jgi:hypothetical protein